MPVTIPNPSGSTTTAKSFAPRPSVSFAKPGPRTPRTPTSEAVIARYINDQKTRWWPRMKLRPSRSWAKVDSTASSVSPAAPVVEPASAPIVGGDGGSVKQKTAARK